MSDESESIGTPAGRVTALAAATLAAKTGPMTRCAPRFTACRAPSCEPATVPPVSMTMSSNGSPRSRMASFAARSNATPSESCVPASPSVAGAPALETGASSATLSRFAAGATGLVRSVAKALAVLVVEGLGAPKPDAPVEVPALVVPVGFAQAASSAPSSTVEPTAARRSVTDMEVRGVRGRFASIKVRLWLTNP